MVRGINALEKASLMAQKILNIISVISFVLVAVITGGGIFSYLWLTNAENQEKLKQQLVEQVTKSIKLPGLSSPALPTATPSKLPKF